MEFIYPTLKVRYGRWVGEGEIYRRDTLRMALKAPPGKQALLSATDSI